jgi:large subunit ribosomal protein L4
MLGESGSGPRRRSALARVRDNAAGGGVAHGPRNTQNYERKINKKARTKALYTILSKKYKEGEVIFVDDIKFDKPKTKDAKNIILSLSKIKGCEKLATKKVNTAILAMDKKVSSVEKSFNNFGNISVEEFRNINPVSILNHTYLIISNPAQSLKNLETKTTK